MEEEENQERWAAATSRREEAGRMPTQPTAPADPHRGVNYLHAFKIVFPYISLCFYVIVII